MAESTTGPSTTTTMSPGTVDDDGDSVLQDEPATADQATGFVASPPSPSSSSHPCGPVCNYGPRLAYTYFSSTPRLPQAEALNQSQDQVHFFTVDDQLVYLSFYQDSGPLNAACLYRFCLHVHTLLEDPSLKSRRIFLYSSDEPDKKANAALLMALYAMIVMRWTPADVLHPIACLELQPFRDAGYSRADFHLSVQSMIYGVHRAIALHLLDLSTFDLVAYETYEKVENGDWNWITPGFVAFASPVEPGYVAQQQHRDLAAGTGAGAGAASGTGASQGTTTNSAAVPARKIEGARPRLGKAFGNVLDEFEHGGVRVVVRLNKKLYDKQHFLDRGMDHVEMYFDDGTNPTLEMTRDFIDLADRTISAGGAVAVHCKAGLGRTGTLIGAYLIYKHGFSADEAIAFMRLMRPGSCVGPQQHYLYENQMTWVRWGAIDTYKAEQRALAPTPTPVPMSSTAAIAGKSRPTTPQRVRTTTPPPPVTPGGSRAGVVPGQPRKTPGKSKNTVASPEVLDEEVGVVDDDMVEGEEGVRLTDEMMLVAAAEDEELNMGETIPSSPRKGHRSVSGTATTSRRAAGTPAPPPPQPQLGLGHTGTTTTRAKTPTTRFARRQHATSASIATPSSTLSTTTVASTRPRPLSAIADNRIVDRIGTGTRATRSTRGMTGANNSTTSSRSGTGSGTGSTRSRTTTVTGARGTINGGRGSATAAAAEVQRSKAVKDLGALFVDPAPSSSLQREDGLDRPASGVDGDDDEMGLGTTEVSGSGSYNLRAGRNNTTPSPPPASSSTGRRSVAGGSAQGLPPQQPPASPSKLPQRIPAKRRGVNTVVKPIGGDEAGGLGIPHAKTTTTNGSAGGRVATTTTTTTTSTTQAPGLTRSVRRRRSSMGEVKEDGL